MAVAETERIFGFVDKRNTVTNTGATSGTPDSGNNYNDISRMRTRLAAINGTYFTSARLDIMTKNDMVYALRQADDSAGL